MLFVVSILVFGTQVLDSHSLKSFERCPLWKFLLQKTISKWMQADRVKQQEKYKATTPCRICAPPFILGTQLLFESFGNVIWIVYRQIWHLRFSYDMRVLHKTCWQMGIAIYPGPQSFPQEAVHRFSVQNLPAQDPL